ncbi:MAG: DUF3048 domain-containing protein [Patescibacteria group bacterium]|nr:DUF3048 domain-containing protein [Patescibacteria group bacterium]
MADIELDEQQENQQEEPQESRPTDQELGKKKKISLKEIKQKINDFFANPKKRLIFIISLGLVIVFAFGFGLYSLSHEKNAADKLKGKNNQANEAKYSAVLDGVMTDQTSANRHPLAIIVENHPDARPQSGLDQASIVYEAIAEGGITRFLAIFGTHEAEKVGPVRSARTYYVDWAHGYNAFLAHVGGNIDALEKIPKDKILDLDQFSYSSPYWRENSVGLATEHTMYTSTIKLREQAKSNKYSDANNFNVMKFKDDPSDVEKASAPDKQKISVVFSNAQYNVDFEYDKTTNSYKRFLADSPHVDKISKNQINPKNVVIMTVKRKPTVTKINETGYDMTTIGSGEAKIFIDGKVIKGTWKKPSATDRELFYDEAGNEVVFNRGQFWICVIPPDGGSVSVQ